MRLNVLRTLPGLLLVLAASLALAYTSGTPPSLTGAAAVGGASGEGNCSGCHSGGLSATLQILDLPEYYEPDSLYLMRVRMTSGASGPTRGGFQITAVRNSDGQGAGAFDITGFSGMQIIQGTGTRSSRRYVQHTAPKFSAGPVEWQFRWRAPGTDEGRIHFFSSGLSSNADGTVSGDRGVQTRDSVESLAALDATERMGGPVNLLLPAAPNPSRGSVSMAYSLAHASVVDLTVIDTQGRRVRTLFSGWQPAGRGQATWDGRRADGAPAGPGVYWAQLRVSGARSVPPRRITLTR